MAKKMSMKEYEKSGMDKKADARELKAINAKRAKKAKKGSKKNGY